MAFFAMQQATATSREKFFPLEEAQVVWIPDSCDERMRHKSMMKKRFVFHGSFFRFYLDSELDGLEGPGKPTLFIERDQDSDGGPVQVSSI